MGSMPMNAAPAEGKGTQRPLTMSHPFELLARISDFIESRRKYSAPGLPLF